MSLNTILISKLQEILPLFTRERDCSQVCLTEAETRELIRILKAPSYRQGFDDGKRREKRRMQHERNQGRA